MKIEEIIMANKNNQTKKSNEELVSVFLPKQGRSLLQFHFQRRNKHSTELDTIAHHTLDNLDRLNVTIHFFAIHFNPTFKVSGIVLNLISKNF